LSAKSIYAQGLTVPELIESVKKAYDGVLASPAVTIDVKDFQHPYFTVMGEVNKPGKYDIREQLTVSQALTVAGGIEPTAKTQLFLLHRDAEAWRVEKLDLKDVLNGRKTSQDRVVRTGDMIVVPEKFIVSFKKYVPYSFNLGTYFQLANVP
jgi:polysaccharide export outer membrane protein